MTVQVISPSSARRSNAYESDSNVLRESLKGLENQSNQPIIRIEFSEKTNQLPINADISNSLPSEKRS